MNTPPLFLLLERRRRRAAGVEQQPVLDPPPQGPQQPFFLPSPALTATAGGADRRNTELPSTLLVVALAVSSAGGLWLFLGRRLRDSHRPRPPEALSGPRRSSSGCRRSCRHARTMGLISGSAGNFYNFISQHVNG